MSLFCWSQTYQTSFAEVGVDRIRQTFKADAVYQVDPASGAVELAIPVGGGIGDGSIHFVPTVTGHVSENLTFHVYGFNDWRNVLTTHPVFLSLLPGYLDLKTGPEADTDFSTFVSQYETWNGVSGSLDGPLTEIDRRIDGPAMLKAFGYTAEQVAVMPPFGLAVPPSTFAKFTSSGDIFLALESADAPRFTLPIWLGGGQWRHETPSKALLVRQGIGYEFTSAYRGASGLDRAGYGVRINRFRLTGIRSRFGERIDISYAGGPNCLDYTATWVQDNSPTGISVRVAETAPGTIQVEYPDAPSDRYEIKGNWAEPDVRCPVYLDYIGMVGKSEAELATFGPFIVKGMYLRVDSITNTTTGARTGISWASYPFPIYHGYYTIPSGLQLPTGVKVQFQWQVYAYLRNGARNGVWQGYFLRLMPGEKEKSDWMTGVSAVTETDPLQGERKTEYWRIIPIPRTNRMASGWPQMTDFNTFIVYPDQSAMLEIYWPPLKASDGGPDKPMPEQLQTLAHLKHVVKERRFFRASSMIGRGSDWYQPSSRSLADKIISYSDLDLRRDGIPGETIQSSVIPMPVNAATIDKTLGVTEMTTRSQWLGAPTFAWAKTVREIHQKPAGYYVETHQRTFSPLLSCGLFPRQTAEAVQPVMDTLGGRSGQYRFGQALPYVQTEFDPANPMLDRVIRRTLVGARESIRTDYRYSAQEGWLADKVAGLTVASPQCTGTTGIARYEFDAMGRLSGIQPQGAGWSRGQATDGLGQVTAQTDPNGLATGFSWDGSGRLTDITPPTPLEPTHVEYDPDLRGARISRAAGGPLEAQRYDGFGQLVRTWRRGSQGEPEHKLYAYDRAGRRTFESIWLPGEGDDGNAVSPGNTAGSRWVYDGFGRVTDAIDARGLVTHTEYYRLTRRVTTGFGTAEAASTDSVRDALGRLLRVTDALGRVTTYTYEPGGQIAQVRQGSADGRRSQTRTWSYNSIGWLTATTQPERGTTLFSDFTVTGKPRRTVFQGDGRGPAREIRATYDDLMRILTVRSPDGTVDQAFTYDGANAGGLHASCFGRANGQLSYARDGAIERFRCYRTQGSSLSDLETRVWPGGQAGVGAERYVHQGFVYDGFGHQVWHAVNDHAMTTGYDRALGVPISAALNEIPVATGQLGSAGLMTGMKFLYGIQAAFQFGPEQTWLQALRYRHDNAILAKWELGYDSQGLLRTDGENAYPEYDKLGRILKAVVPRLHSDSLRPDPAQAVTQAYGYDAFGNLIENFAAPLDPTDGANQSNFRFDDHEQSVLAESNRLPRTASGVPTGAEYDAQGNLTGIFKQASSVKVQKLSLTYDALARVSSVTDAAKGTTQQYFYSPEGLRIVIKDYLNGQWVRTRFNLYDDERRLMSQYEGPGAGTGTPAPSSALAWERDFIYLGRQQVGELDAKGLHVILADPLGTPRWVVDAGGGVTGAQKFLPFGETLDQGGTQLPGKGFTNHEQTEASGLIYMQGRFYLPQYHRFVSPDPGHDQRPDDPQSWNSYAYVQNDPISKFDPDGQEQVNITFRAFIPQSQVLGFFGDSRGFSPSPDASSRVSVNFQIETDPSKNHGNPLIGTPQIKIQPTHMVFTGWEKTATGPQLPLVRTTMDKAGMVNINIQENVKNPFQFIGLGIRSNMDLTINQTATHAWVSGNLSGAPSFELNFTPTGEITRNLPLQVAPSLSYQFIFGLQNTVHVENGIDLSRGYR